MDYSIISYLIAAATAIGLARWRLKKKPTTLGSADWLPIWKASGKGLFRSGGLLAGDWTAGLPVYYHGDGHAITIAPAGTGKGTTAIIPNLLTYPWIFLLDPGGENTAICAKAWRAKGYEFVCLNPWGMHGTAPWSLPVHTINPLDLLDPALNSFASDADLLAEMIVTREGQEQGSSAFFKDAAQSVIRAMLMHIATTEPAERRNLVTLYRYINSGLAEWGALIDALIANAAAGGVIAAAGNQLGRREGQASEEHSAIISTIQQDTGFLGDLIMQQALHSSTVDLSALKGKRGDKQLRGCVVSVVVPLEFYRTHAAYARLITGVALWAMQRGAVARHKVLFLMDEFPELGRVDRIASGLATLRKYSVRFWPICQDFGQIRALYGRSAETFLTNAGFKQFIASGSIETAEYISRLCGDTTVETESTNHKGEVSRSHARRALVTPDEVLHLNGTQQIVHIDTQPPLLLRKVPYWKRPGLRGLYERNPYVARTPGLGLAAYPKLLWGLGARLIAWAVRPAPAIVFAAIAALAFALAPGINVGGGWDTGKGELVCTYLMTDGQRRFWMPGRKAGDACPVLMLSGWGIGG